jgi:DNA-binding helix-hairpin-helix protein with protein kinase domain
MADLERGTIIKTIDLRTLSIVDKLGVGGQGTVYRIDCNGQTKALKWYHKNIFNSDKHQRDFYENLKHNKEKGAPTKAFLWPEDLTDVIDGTFGYVMDLRPGGYNELGEFFCDNVRFKSWVVIADAALNIVEGFRALHNNGYSYQDLNDGNFFINPQSGDVLICDNDNVAPDKTNLGILGKQRYMAPEIVSGGGSVEPDKITDRFSMAVILFRLFFRDHPLEGRYSTPPCMTKGLEKKYYGTEPIFIFDPKNDANRPIPNVQKNAQILWNVAPGFLKDMFIESFSKEAMVDSRVKRPIEKAWVDTIVRFRSDVVKCPKCVQEMFIDGNQECKCYECGQPIKAQNVLTLPNFSVAMFPGVKVYSWHVDSMDEDTKSMIAEVIKSPANPDQYGLKNISEKPWNAQLGDKLTSIAPGKVVPVKQGMKITFANGKNAVIE